ncbi:Receptor-like serine/threonine-protein kinase [Forsythia ovata]|uniref:Receptor-like serine/threonine-protein kinase n=1 Tax=Forsythia ovata TaxID=205694 RepID=A0ABD1VE31_9LAMI
MDQDSRTNLWETSNVEKGNDLKLLESGNLVLLNEQGKIVWQSFEFPTDTLLPGMNLTTQQWLTSWKSSSDPAPGRYSVRLNPPDYATTPTAIPTRSSKNQVKKRDSKYKETHNVSRPSSEILSSSSSSSKLKIPEEATTGPTPVSILPIVASSLGLNKMKTRSGPLPHESFFSSGSRDRGASLGSRTLSKPLGSGGTGGVDGGFEFGVWKEKE